MSKKTKTKEKEKKKSSTKNGMYAGATTAGALPPIGCGNYGYRPGGRVYISKK